MTFIRLILADLRSAFMLLTRLPIEKVAAAAKSDQLSRSVWAFPVVGAVVGLIAAIAFSAAKWAGFADLIAVIMALLIGALTTGALHEDGLADVADGFGGGFTKDEKLAIMRDSRIGTYGVIALLFSFGLRAAALTIVSQFGSASVAIFVAAILSRGMMAGAVAIMRPARIDGMGKLVDNPPYYAVGIALLLALLPAFNLYGALSGAVLTAAAILSAGSVCLVARSQVDGYTGDVLGSVQQVSEITLLVMISLLVE